MISASSLNGTLNYDRILKAIEASTENTAAHITGWKLVEGWIKRYYDIDRRFTILKVEPELSMFLDPKTLLIGRVDLIAETEAGDKFFGEWKSANPRKKSEWRLKWRMAAQSLTYGVLTSQVFPDIQKFCVRQAFKTTPPSYDQEWFTFSKPELNFWREQLILIAQEIREYRLRHPNGPWQPNWDHCYRYGPNYVCPYYGNGCLKLEWNNKHGFLPRVSHLDLERSLNGVSPDLVVLDASRVGEYLNCHERYRKTYEENLVEPPGESLETGTVLHAGLDDYFTQIQETQKC